MAFETWSGAHSGRSPTMIFPFEWNSVGAPNETPTIWPAQPPRTLSSNVARSRWRTGGSPEPRMPEGVAATRASVSNRQVTTRTPRLYRWTPQESNGCLTACNRLPSGQVSRDAQHAQHEADKPSGVRPRDTANVATIRQVAAMAGVSTATVSRVLARSGRVSADLEARVHSAAKELNYQPNRAARALRVRQGSTVGVLIPDIQNLFFTAIIRGIDDEIQRHGYTTLLANSDNSFERERIYFDTFRAEGVAGLLVIPSQCDEAIYHQFLETGVPLVVELVVDRFIALRRDDE